MVEIGSQAWLYGSLSSGNPNAEYTVDGIPGELPTSGAA